jgi:hypothetical protein
MMVKIWLLPCHGGLFRTVLFIAGASAIALSVANVYGKSRCDLQYSFCV